MGANIRKEDNEKTSGKGKSRPAFIILAVLIVAAVLFAVIRPGGDTEDVTVPEETTETAAEQSDRSSEAASVADGSEMASIRYEMWDHPDTGSAASNDDEYHSNYWTVYYDPDTRVFKKIVEQHLYDLQGYSEDEVLEYVNRLKDNWNGDSSVNVNYIGGVTGNAGNFYVLEVEYNNVDDPAVRAKADNIFMAMDWGTTIDDADRIIKALGGVEAGAQ